LLDGAVAIQQDTLRIDLVRTLWGARVQEEAPKAVVDVNQPETAEAKAVRVTSMLQRAVDLSCMLECTNCHASASLFDHNYKECMVLNCPCGHFICAYCGTTGRDTNNIHAHVKMMHPLITVAGIQHGYYATELYMGGYILQRLKFWLLMASEAGYGRLEELLAHPVVRDFEATVCAFGKMQMAHQPLQGDRYKFYMWCVPASLWGSDPLAHPPVLSDEEATTYIRNRTDADMWFLLSYSCTRMTGATANAAIAFLTRLDALVRPKATTEYDLLAMWSDDTVRETIRLMREEREAGRLPTFQHLAYLLHQGLWSSGVNRCGADVWNMVCANYRAPAAAGGGGGVGVGGVGGGAGIVANPELNNIYVDEMQKLRRMINTESATRTNAEYWTRVPLPATGTKVAIPTELYTWLLNSTVAQVTRWREVAAAGPGAGAGAAAGAGAGVGPAAAAGAGAGAGPAAAAGAGLGAAAGAGAGVGPAAAAAAGAGAGPAAAAGAGAGPAAAAGAGAGPAAAAGAGAGAALLARLCAAMAEHGISGGEEDLELQLAMQLSLQEAYAPADPPADPIAPAAAAAPAVPPRAPAAPHVAPPRAPPAAPLPPLPQFPSVETINRYTIPILRTLLQEGGITVKSSWKKGNMINVLILGWMKEQYSLYHQPIEEMSVPTFDTWVRWPRIRL